MKRKTGPTAPTNETPEQKLKRLASMRVSKAVHYVKLCGKLASYKPTDDQKKKILEALKNAVIQVSDQMSSDRPSAKLTFSL